MQTKLLHEIVTDIAGKQAGEIIDLLIGKKDVNEFLIAKKLKLTINQVRNILYKLSNYNLVSFIRKKDKRKGWYTYFWTLDIEKSLELLSKKLEKKIWNLQHQLKSREEKRFYYCDTCKIEVSEETALLHDFYCKECGEVYQLSDKKEVIENLKKEIAKLERQRQNVLNELEKVKESKLRKRKRAREKEKKKASSKKSKKKKAVKKKTEKLKRKKKPEKSKKKKAVKKKTEKKK